MNTYRVKLRRNDLSPRVFTFDVDACKPDSAITKAMKGIAVGEGNIDASVRLVAKDIKRHYSDPWVRAA